MSRDVARHSGRGAYRAVAAQGAATVGRERPKLFAVERSRRLRAVVCRLLWMGTPKGASGCGDALGRSRANRFGSFPEGCRGPRRTHHRAVVEIRL